MLLGKSGWFLFHKYVREAGMVLYPIIQGARSLRWEDAEFEASLGCIVRTCVKTEPNKRTNQKLKSKQQSWLEGCMDSAKSEIFPAISEHSQKLAWENKLTRMCLWAQKRGGVGWGGDWEEIVWMAEQDELLRDTDVSRDTRHLALSLIRHCRGGHS